MRRRRKKEEKKENKAEFPDEKKFSRLCSCGPWILSQDTSHSVHVAASPGARPDGHRIGIVRSPLMSYVLSLRIAPKHPGRYIIIDDRASHAGAREHPHAIEFYPLRDNLNKGDLICLEKSCTDVTGVLLGYQGIRPCKYYLRPTTLEVTFRSHWQWSVVPTTPNSRIPPAKLQHR